MTSRRSVSSSGRTAKRTKIKRISPGNGVWYKKLLVLLFLVTIFAPLTANILPILPKNNVYMENRNPRPLPSPTAPILTTASDGLLNRCLEYFAVIDEEFNGRTFLLAKHFAIQRFLFGAGSKPARRTKQDAVASMLAGNKRTADDYRQKIERLHLYFTERDIPYMLAVTPDKNYHDRGSFRDESPWLRALASGLKERESPVDFFFMDDILKKHRDDKLRPLFYLGDSHWNHVGGYWGYVAFMERIRRFLPDAPILLPEKNFTYKTIRTSKPMGDFQWEGKTEQKYCEDDYVPVFFGNDNVRITPIIETPTYEINDRMVGLIESSNPDRKYTILILRDSYGIGMMPFFDHTFGKCVYFLVHHYTHKANNMDEKISEIANLVDLHKPDVVIQLTDPRHFYMAFP